MPDRRSASSEASRGRPIPPDSTALRSVVETAYDAILVGDGTGRVRYANAAAAMAFACTVRDLVGRPLSNLVGDPHRDAADGFHRLVRSGHSTNGGRTIVAVGRRLNGTRFTAEINLRLWTEGARPKFAAILRDVTERKRAEQRGRQMRHQRSEIRTLRRMNDFRAAFLNTAAHELRTPLTPIRTMLYVLRKRAEGTGGQVQDLEIIERNFRRLQHLVDDILDGARFQAGRLRVRKGPMDLTRLAGESVRSFQAEAGRRGLDLKGDLRDAVWVDADEGRLGQVLFNLLSNAMKFTPAGGSVTVSVAATPDHAFMAVRDTGIGMDAADRRRLFQPFVQVQETGQREAGTGLGLWICKGIVELHAGVIRCSSRGRGQGSEFRVTLPLRKGGASAVPSAPPLRAGTRPAWVSAETVAERSKFWGPDGPASTDVPPRPA